MRPILSFGTVFEKMTGLARMSKTPQTNPEEIPMSSLTFSSLSEPRNSWGYPILPEKNISKNKTKK